LFAAALADLTRQGYDEAIANLRSFVTRYPRDPRVADARLRLGDAFSAMRRYAEAISEYEAVIQSFPDSPLVPAALYRQGQARLALGDQTGCRLFRDVAGRFPQSPEASLARQALSSACQ
jgi:tol-pal system protein YbgF